MDTNNNTRLQGESHDENFPVVMENDFCPYWEPAKDTSLTPMRECWYCKFSDFRKENKEHRVKSVCRCPKNMLKRI